MSIIICKGDYPLIDFIIKIIVILNVQHIFVQYLQKDNNFLDKI